MLDNHYPSEIGDYVFGKRAGKGAFAEVYKGHNKKTKEEVAIKVISRTSSSYNMDDMIEKEISILKTLDHPNIVRFVHFDKNSKYYFLIFEFCGKGDLSDVIKNFYNGKVPEAEAQKFIQQIIEGIKAMKARNIVHRDLKLANILVSNDFFLKIADFGLARFIEQDDVFLKSMVGTPLNMDPLILEKNTYNNKCDIWSLGVIFYQILVGRPPYNPGRGAGIQDLIALIQRQPVIFPADIPISDSFKSLIRSMLVIDVNKRISFEDLFNHDWITGKNLIVDPKKDSFTDLSATQLLQSMYIKKEEECKKVEKKPEVDFKSLSDKEKQYYLCGAVFLAESYEIFQPKIALLKESLLKLQGIKISVDPSDDEKLCLVQSLLTLDLLKLIREVLSFKLKIVGENKKDVIINIDFITFWEKITKNKIALQNLLGKEKVITDLYSQLKSDYIELFDKLCTKLQELKETFDKFKGHNQEKLLIDSLIQLSENSAFREFLQDDKSLKIDQYNNCYQICELLLFKNSFEFNFPKISIKTEREDLKDFDVNVFYKFVSEFLNSKISSSAFLQMSQIEEMKKKFDLIQSSIVIHEPQSSEPSEFDQTLKKFQVMLGKRINDLTGNEDVELSF